VRLPNLGKEEKAIFKHLDADSLEQILKSQIGKFLRVVVITDGVFSMLGEYQDLRKIRSVIDQYDQQYPEGILLIVDDCHGVGASDRLEEGVRRFPVREQMFWLVP
jgi:glycine C-acetyltransferase